PAARAAADREEGPSVGREAARFRAGRVRLLLLSGQTDDGPALPGLGDVHPRPFAAPCQPATVRRGGQPFDPPRVREGELACARGQAPDPDLTLNAPRGEAPLVQERKRVDRFLVSAQHPHKRPPPLTATAQEETGPLSRIRSPCSASRFRISSS